MKTTRRLLMRFLTTENKTVSISVDNPREDVTEQEIKDVMDLIISENLFAPNGYELSSLVDAKIVVTNTNEYDLA